MPELIEVTGNPFENKSTGNLVPVEGNPFEGPKDIYNISREDRDAKTISEARGNNKPTKDALTDIGQGMLSALKMSPFKLAESLTGILDTIEQYNPATGMKGVTSQITGVKTPRPMRDASMYFRDFANQQAPELGTPGYYTQSAVASILSNVPSIIAGFATGSQLVGLLGMGAQVAEDKYNERIKAGDTEAKARMSAGLYGAAEAVGEKIPLGILMKNKGVKAILLSSLTEIPTEIATTIMQNGVDIGLHDQEMSFNDWVQSLADTAIITGISAPFTAGLGRGLGVGAQRIMERRQAKQIKPVIMPEVVQAPVSEASATVTPEVQTKGSKMIATLDGVEVGTYDGERLLIKPAYEGNRYAIASSLMDAYKENKVNAEAMLTKNEEEAKVKLADELRSKGFTEAEIAQRQAEIRTGSEASMAASVDQETTTKTAELNQQPYEEFISQVTNQEQPTKPILEALNEGDFDTLTKYANNFPNAQSFADAIGEEARKPSRIWKDNGYKSAFEFYRKRRTTQERISNTDMEGFVNEETGELIGSDYQTADSVTLDGLLKKLEGMKKWYAENPIPKIKKFVPMQIERSIEKVKTRIRRITGQTHVDNLVNEMDALEFAYKKAEQESRNAYKVGDKAGALREHERMTLIQQLKKARMDLNRETKATFKYLDSVNKKLPTMKISDEYRSALESVLSYDGDALETFSLKQLEAGDIVFIPEDMIETLKETEREGITLEQLRNQKDIVKTLLYQARALNKIEVMNEKADFMGTVETIVQEISEAWHKDVETLLTRLNPSEREKQKALGYKNVSRFQQIRETVGGLMSYPKKAEYIIEKAVNYARNNKFYQVTFQRTVEAERTEITRRRVIDTTLKEAVDLIAPDINNIVKQEYIVPGLLNPITKQKAIMVALNSGNEQNRKALRGVGLNEQDIDNVTASLNDNETEFVLKIWALIDAQYDALNEQYKKLTGLPMGKVAGQYFPLKYDTSTPQTGYVAEQQAKQDLFKTYSEVSSVYRGMTKARVRETSYPPLLDFSVITNHLADVNHFIAWGVPVRDINRVLTNPMVKESLIQSVGEDQYNQLRPWLRGIANDHFDGMKWVNKTLGKMLNNASVAILGFSLSTTLLQPSAVFQAINYSYEGADGKMRRIGVNEILQGYIDFYKSYGENADIITSLSPWMSDRTNNLDYNVRRALEADNSKPFNDHKFRKAAFAMMGFTDKLTTMPVWWTGYNIAMKEYGDEQKAVDFADKLARNTQGSGSAKDLSEIQRGGSVRRAFTMFQTFFNATYNEWGKTKDLVQGERVGSLEYAKTFMWITFLPALLSALMRYRDDLLDEPQKIASETVGYGFGSIPIVGGFINSLMGNYEFRPTPAASLPTELIKLTYSKDVPNALKHGIAATGYLTGLPTRQALLTGEWVFDALTGDVTDPLNMVYKKQEKK